MILLYFILWTLLTTLALPLALLPALWSPRWADALEERLGLGRWQTWLNGGQRPIWFHGASVGEVLGLQPVVRVLQAQNPQTAILVSTTSLTGRAEAEKRNLSVAPVLLPLDHPLLWLRIFARLRPRLLVIAETEIWPGLLMTAHLFNVPVAIVNGRISDYSFQRYLLIGFFLKPLLQTVARLMVQTDRDARRFAALGVSLAQIKVLGSSKYDQGAAPLLAAELAELRRDFGFAPETPVFVAGSVRPAEVEIVLDVFEKLRTLLPDLQLLLAPRHPERFEAAAGSLLRRGLSFNRRSAGLPMQNEPVLLLDTLGELSRAYAVGALAFVGGSLEDIGGHNPLEPAIYAVPLVLGPYTANVRDAVEELKQAGGMREVHNGRELAAVSEELLLSPALGREMGEAARKVALRHVGATARMAAELQPLCTIGEAFAGQSGFSRLMSAALMLLSLPYALGVFLRNRFYDWGWRGSYRAALPVISVGNLTAGGNGKTPFTAFVARELLRLGRRPVILSRGYGGSLPGPHRLRVGDLPALVGDEAAMQKTHFGDALEVVIARRRADGARLIERENLGDVILLDDGFQHRALARDLDLLMVDVSTPAARTEWENGRLLPWGRFRELKAEGLKRASALILVARGATAPTAVVSNLPQYSCQLVPDCFVDIASGETFALDRFLGVPGVALTAIAKPADFFSLLESLGVPLEQRIAYRDHYLFSEADLAPLRGRRMFVTEKDAVKLRFLVQPGECFALRLAPQLVTAAEQENFLALLKKLPGA